MKPVLVLYATVEGQTRRVAEHLAATLRARDVAVDVVHAAALPAGFDIARYERAIVAASVHAGKHEREMVAFVKARREALERIPTAFLSVSLTETTVEDPKATEEKRAEATAAVRRMVDLFLTETGWHPRFVHPVAGALAYSQYGFLKRFVLKMIAKRAGGATDTSRDYEYTDWQALDRFVDELLAAPAT